MNIVVRTLVVVLILITMMNPVMANEEWVLQDGGVSVEGGVIPVSMRAACGSYIDEREEQCQMPNASDVCISLTAYWPFDENGEPVPWNNQADSTPSQTANGFFIDTTSKNSVAAAPLPLVGGNVDILGYKAQIHDTFGNIVYQNGIFWHDGWESWVLPIDILSDDEIHYLVCDDFLVQKNDIKFDGLNNQKTEHKNSGDKYARRDFVVVKEHGYAVEWYSHEHLFGIR